MRACLATGARLMHLPHSHLHPLALPWALTLLPLGFALGCGYVAALRRSGDCLLGGRPGARGLLLLRLAAVVVLLAAGAQWGAAALLALFGGFLLSRPLALRSARAARSRPKAP